ncbi:hypothetical protein ACOME3_001656 [Neoechinorhynchus agilis]
MMERYLGRCMYEYLRCDPDDYLFLMTESPLSGPESRENLAEIMFETFNVSGLFIGEQAILALLASWLTRKNGETVSSDDDVVISGTPAGYTGTVVDCGDGVTHVVPVVEGYVIGSCIKRMPISGRDITSFVQNLIRERETLVPPEQSLETAKAVKESLCYVCPDIMTEFGRYDREPEKYMRQYDSVNNVTKQQFTIDIGYERFLAPEIFFHPEFVNGEYLKSLATVVDEVIQSCPTDVKRGLYKNIVLSGGSTLFKDFGKRLRRDLQVAVNRRQSEQESLGLSLKPQPIQVKVVSHPMQKYAAWFGGSLYANTPSFRKAYHTKAEYDEHGPSVCRQNLVGLDFKFD